MARRRIDGTPVSRETGIQREPSRATGTTFVPVEARRLATVGEDHPVWRDAANGIGGPVWSGAIVRVKPPPDVTDQEIEAVRADLLEAGAAKVTVLPRRKADTVPQKVVEDRRKFRSLGPRKVVLELVESSSSSEKEILRGICEGVMAEMNL